MPSNERVELYTKDGLFDVMYLPPFYQEDEERRVLIAQGRKFVETCRRSEFEEQTS